MVKTLAFTYYTKASDTNLVYSASEWTTVRLGLQSAGPVVAGMDPNLYPVGQGKGRQLPTDRDLILVLAPADRLYLAADSIQGVGVSIEGIPETSLLMQLIQAVQTPTQVITTEGKPPVWPFRF